MSFNCTISMLFSHTLLIGIFLPATLPAQESELNNSFHFRDGIYLTIDDIKKNTPCFPDDSIQISLYDTPEASDFGTGQWKVVSLIELKDKNEGWKAIPLNQIFGIALEGELYIRTGRFKENYDLNAYSYHQWTVGPEGVLIMTHPGIQTPFATRPSTSLSTSNFIFNRLTQAGSICLILDANTGSRKKMPNQLMLKMKSGEMFKANAENLRRFIYDDKELYQAFQSDRQNQETVFHYITQYNMRNKTMLPVAK